MPEIPPSDALIESTLTSVFGHQHFRPLQREIVSSILHGQDVFVLMPTGGGKSLCYQLPALLRDGFTVVVSPLIALMKDQVDKLESLGIAATFINSSLEPREVSVRQAAAMRGALKLLYVAPERLMMPGFLQLLGSKPPAAFAIDEAHCISEWGHDFRPEYRQLRQLRGLFPSATIAAFTATATRRVQTDILSQLGLRQPSVYRGSFNRPNLFYEVRPKKRAYEQLRAYLQARRGDAGIIYCQARAATEDLAARLQADGFSAAAYHAGLEADQRRDRQEAFVSGSVQIIVATIAFGMGIDKPDVRFVVHYDLPKNLEGYYQESGRGGRDGKPSDCILFYTYADVAKQEYFINQKSSSQERAIATAQLRGMVNWADRRQCRRRSLLRYFDDDLQEQEGRCCDVCDGAVGAIDCTAPAQLLLSCVQLTAQACNLSLIIRILRGSLDQRIATAGYERLRVFGAGRDRSREDWHNLGDALLGAGYIRQTAGAHGLIALTVRGETALARSETIRLTVLQSGGDERMPPPAVATDATQADTAADEALFQQLRAFRKRLADERGVAPFIIFHDSVLRQVAATRPADLAGLGRIPGIGRQKLDDFGEQVLAVVGESVVRHLDPVASPPPAASARIDGLSDSVLDTVALFQAGHDVQAIARQRGRSSTTIAQHLALAIQAGELVDFARLVNPERQRTIEAVFTRVGLMLLKPAKEQLGDSFSYDELRYVQAAMRARSE